MNWPINVTIVTAAAALASVRTLSARAPLIVESRLVSERRVLRAGDTFRIGVYLRMPPDAHIYWINPGVAGLPTRVQWKVPEGFQVGPTEWPAPVRFVSPPVVSHGYSGDVLIWTTVRVPAGIQRPGTAHFQAKVEWLLCRETCVPGEADLTLPLRIGQRAKDSSVDLELFRRFELLRPKQNAEWKFEFTEDDHTVTLFAQPPPSYPERRMSRLVFIPVTDDLTDSAASQTWEQRTHEYSLRLPKTARRKNVGNLLEGVLREGDDGQAAVGEWCQWVRATKRIQDKERTQRL